MDIPVHVWRNLVVDSQFLMMKCTMLLVGFKDTVWFPCEQFNYVVENSTLSFSHSAVHETCEHCSKLKGLVLILIVR